MCTGFFVGPNPDSGKALSVVKQRKMYSQDQNLFPLSNLTTAEVFNLRQGSVSLWYGNYQSPDSNLLQ
jgi:hypothetical protein